jgi:glucose uptake protein GlcU
MSSADDAATQIVEAWGWVAAGVGALAHGSWGAAIKATPSLDNNNLPIEIHPLVFQSYKTSMLFLTCWLSLIPLGTDHPKWTPYGILSGIMFVVGGVGGIVAIQNAGVSVAVGTWASIMVAINFIWGIVVFKEPVHSFWETVCAFGLLTTGLIGMSHYSSTTRTTTTATATSSESIRNDLGEPSMEMIPSSPTSNTSLASVLSTGSVDSADSSDHPSSAPGTRLKSRRRQQQVEDDTNDDQEDEQAPLVRLDTEPGDSPREEIKRTDNAVLRLGVKYGLNKRQVGIICAVWNGIFNGSSLLPLHYAKAQGFGGLNYMVSFGSGSLIANLFIWLVFWGTEYMAQNPEVSPRSWKVAWGSLPPFHWTHTWKQGVIAGSILSAGMYGSIISTTVLGQGVGNSLIQCKIFISGLWGILIFHEITERQSIFKWFASATLSVVAIILLSYERLAAG